MVAEDIPPPTRLHWAVFFWGGLTLILLFLGLSITSLTNNDIWLHMANGRWILEHGQVPLTDPYSFSAAGHRFHAHEWLAGVIFHLVHLLAGVNGLIFFKTALGGTALALTMTAAYRQGARPVSLALCTMVTLAVVNSRFLERPEMFSFAFTALYMLILARDHQRHGQPAAARGGLRDFLQASLLWWLVPVQWLWVQIHGYFITGLALAGTFLLAETLDRLLRRENPGSRPPLRRLISGWAALGVMTVLGLINPNGYEIYLFPFRLAGGDNIFMQTIFEWRPTFTTGLMTQSSMFLAFCAWLSLLTVGCLASPGLLRRDRLWRGVSIIGLLLLPALRPVLAAGATLSQAWESLRTGSALSALPLRAGTGLPGAAWLWSPAELMGSITGQPGLAAALSAPLAPLRLLGGWGDDLFTLVWLALAVMTVLRWRRPAAAGLAVLATLLTFLALLAGSWAAGLMALTLLPALAWATWSKRLPFWHMAVTLVFLVLALRQNRNIVNFALVTLPLVAPALTRLRTALPRAASPGDRRRAAMVAAAATALAGTFLVVLTFTTGWPYTPGITKKVGLGVGSRIPSGAVAYIRDRDLKGQVFNKYAYGAYLIHELYPATRVFMDSRNAVYGEKLYKLYLNTLNVEQVAARTFKTYHFDYVAIDYTFYPGRSPDQGLLSYLRSRPEWVLVEFDDRSLIYVRDGPEHADLIRRDAYRTLDPTAYAPGRLRDASARVRAAFAAESSKALARHPGSRAARLLSAEAALVAGRDTAALELYEQVLAADPGDIFALVTAARVALRLGQREQGLAHYRHALALRPALEDLRTEFLQAQERGL